jgi:hypothetical protein
MSEFDLNLKNIPSFVIRNLKFVIDYYEAFKFTPEIGQNDRASHFDAAEYGDFFN